MDKNVGGMDRTARFAVGGLLALAGVGMIVAGVPSSGGTLMTLGVPLVVLVVGGILLGTGGVQKCPINEAAGIDTYEGEE